MLNFVDQMVPQGPDGMPVTRRGAFIYSQMLGLNHKHLYNKKILDVGSGKSKFTTLINTLYKHTDTEAIAFDCCAQRGFKDDIYVQGDAFNLPFNDKSLDLVTSVWFLNHFWESVTSNGQRSLFLLVSEMIRVTKAGGEIRFIVTPGARTKGLEAFLNVPSAASRCIE